MTDFKSEDLARIKSEYKVDYKIVQAKQQEILNKLKKVFNK